MHEQQALALRPVEVAVEAELRHADDPVHRCPAQRLRQHPSVFALFPLLSSLLSLISLFSHNIAQKRQTFPKWLSQLGFPPHGIPSPFFFSLFFSQFNHFLGFITNHHIMPFIYVIGNYSILNMRYYHHFDPLFQRTYGRG